MSVLWARPPRLALLDPKLCGQLGLVASHLRDEPLSRRMNVNTEWEVRGEGVVDYGVDDHDRETCTSCSSWIRLQLRCSGKTGDMPTHPVVHRLLVLLFVVSTLLAIGCLGRIAHLGADRPAAGRPLLRT
jgi:hypothetical protein